MLVWHDSLGYRSLGYFAANYPTYVGTPTFGADHERAAGRAISGTVTFDTPVLPTAQDTSVVGLLLKVDGITTVANSVFEWHTAGGTSLQVRARSRGGNGGFYLQFERGLNEDVLLRTEVIPYGTWVFLEMKVTFSQSEGKIVVRVDGQETDRVEGLKTEATLTDRGWDSLRVQNWFPGSSLSSMADLYVCDARADHGKTFQTFLGKSTSTKLLAGQTSRMDWATDSNPAVTNKTRLIIFAGQSNFTGRSTDTSNLLWRSPNPVVQIWDRLTHPAPGQWEDLKATLNTAGMFLPSPVAMHGPEMRFAERMAQMLERAGPVSGSSSVKIIKGTQDGSFIAPLTADYSWYPGVTNNLYNGIGSPRGCLLTDILSAVASLGGWAFVESVDFFWLQGESDSIFTATTAVYRELLTQFFDLVRSDMLAPTTIYLFRIHKDLYTGTAPDSIGFYWRDAIRNTHWSLPNTIHVSIDDCEISGDLTHLSTAGYNRLGDIAFDAWFAEQNFASRIDDYTTETSVDQLWLGTDGTQADAKIAFEVDGLQESGNSPSLAVVSQFHAAHTSSPVEIFAVAGGGVFPGITPSSTSWVNYRQVRAGVALPETLSLDIGMTV